jgi:ABC-type transport system involved in multi-copper enzyme maturation permease subunit
MNGVVIAETVRRTITSGVYLIFLALTAIVALAAAQLQQPGSLWPGLVGLLALIMGCQNIGPEFSSGTLQLILAKPVNRSAYLLSRVAGAVIIVALTAWIAWAVEMAGRLLKGTAADSLQAVTANAANASLDAILVCSLLALFGSFSRSYLNIALYLLLQFGLDITGAVITMLVRMPNTDGILAALGKFFTDHPSIGKGFAAVSHNLFPDEPQRVFDGDWTMLVITNSAIALLVACVMFRRREVPYGAD